MGRPRKSDESRTLAQAVGRRLRALRIERGLTQDQFAELVGIHRNAAGFIERGENTVTIHTLSRAAKALKTAASEILRDVGH